MAREYADPTGVPGSEGVVMVSAADDGGVTVTFAWDVRLGSCTLTAVTVTVVWMSTAGAVNRPWAEILPRVADQVTAGSLAYCATPVS